MQRKHRTLTPNIVIDKSYAIKENYAIAVVVFFLLSPFSLLSCPFFAVELATMCSIFSKIFDIFFDSKWNRKLFFDGEIR